MAKYFIDTEFVERPCTIDLISIAIVADDGRERYFLNSHCSIVDAWNDKWIRENVLWTIHREYAQSFEYAPTLDFSYESVWRIFDLFAKTPREIADSILALCNIDPKIEFWGYYADYDWVAFCWLFGRMIDLPLQFPKYCRDVKQLCDMKGNPKLPDRKEDNHSAIDDARWIRKAFDFLNKGDVS